LAAVALPILLAGRPVGEIRPAAGPPGTDLLPPPNAVDVWGDHGAGVDFDVSGRLAARRAHPVAQPPAALAAEVAPGTVGGFTLVGSVAVMPGDDATVLRVQTGFGVEGRTLAALSRRYLAAFGDQYDQIAVFLGFTDRNSTMSLAYQQPIVNNTKGLGMPLFDGSRDFGSAGRLQTMLNMKRINIYGRDAAADPDNGLYAVWAQEAAHRWLVYFRFKRAGDAAESMALLGRQKAHWEVTVQADASIMDGYKWVDNADGTFTAVERGVRYGALDQYGMGLRLASEVPPFFMLEEITDMAGAPVMNRFARMARYKARRVDLTIDDIIRGSGPREPEVEVAAQDLRMGVVLLGPPGVGADQLIGEAFAIDNSRRLWTEFYNEAGGGRGKVCTELFRPCRGPAFDFTEARLVEAASVKEKDGVVTPGEQMDLELRVTNQGSEAGRAKLTVNAGAALTMKAATVDSPELAPGASAVVKLAGRATRAMACAQTVMLDVTAPGRLGSSRGRLPVVLGILPQKLESFDDAEPAGWRVNPDGTDAGMAGRWARGEPQRTLAFDYTLQPGAAFSGRNAFATGLTAAQEDNVEGKTTLESPPFAIAGVRAPMLSYQVYFVAADFAQEVLVPAPSGSLQVLASIDGKPFVEIDRLTGMATGWQRRIVPLAGAPGAADAGAGPAAVQLRFVVEEATVAARPVVEAVIDDVGIFGEAPACEGAGEPGAEPDGGVDEEVDDGGGGCGCRVAARGGGGVGSVGALGALVGLALLLGRRRARARRS
jgi:hypothetical protein